jgi:phage repressor protein C with HTH and peptisase S24 domain
MQTISERLGELISTLGYNVNSFSKEIGYSNNNVTIGRIIADKEKMPSAETMQKISNKFPDVSLDWLITGRGAMLKNEQNQENANKAIAIGRDANGSKINIDSKKSIDDVVKIVEKYQMQADRLLTIIEKLTNKKENGTRC